MWKTKTTCVHVDLPHSREGLLEQKLEVSLVMKEEELHKITILHISNVTLQHEKFLQFDWLIPVVFQLNLKYLHVKITNLLWVVV